MRKNFLNIFIFLCFLFVYTVLMCHILYDDYEPSDTCPNCGASEYRIERYENTNLRQYPKRKKIHDSNRSSQYLAGNQTPNSLERKSRIGANATTRLKLIG